MDESNSMSEENKGKSYLGKQFVRFSRGRFYAGIIQFLLVIILTIRSFDTQAIIGISSFSATILALPLGLLIMWSIGYIDDIYGFFRHQKNYQTQINPFFKKLMKKVKTIEKKISN